MKGLSQEDISSSVRANALDALIRINVDDKDLLYNTLNDSSYLVASIAIDAYLKATTEDSEKIITQFESLNNGDIVSVIADYHIKNNSPKKYEWFVEKIQHADRKDFAHFLGNLAFYLSNQEEEWQLKGIKFLQQYAHYKNPEVRRSVFLSILNLRKNKKVEDTLKMMISNETNEQLKALFEELLRKK